MGYKKVCLKCRKSFSLFKNESDKADLKCPECGQAITIFNHKFRPPKRDDINKWKAVEFLKEHGFVYQHIFQKSENGSLEQVVYPTTLQEAKVFVDKYKSQAL